MKEQVFPFLSDSKYRAFTVLSRLDLAHESECSKYLSSAYWMASVVMVRAMWIHLPEREGPAPSSRGDRPPEIYS